MLILPIVNRNSIKNVQIQLKGAQKTHKGITFENMAKSDIIINSEKFSDSHFRDSKDKKAPVDFIRAKSLLYPRNFMITTDVAGDSSLYDVYEVKQPPRKVNDALDNLLGAVLIDMYKEIPMSKKGKYVSLEKLGFNEFLTDEKLAKLQKIVAEEKDINQWSKRFTEEGLEDLQQIIEFMDIFDCVVVSDTSIPIEDMENVLKGLEALNTKDARSLRKYYNMALTNKEIYSKLSYINRLLYNRPYTLIQSKKQRERQLVKVKAESELKKVA